MLLRDDGERERITGNLNNYTTWSKEEKTGGKGEKRKKKTDANVPLKGPAVEVCLDFDITG